ncbi:lanC-like protein GCL1 isoform X2 [Physcomitrium patens]|nr:lanC-like protein GCL1 isoform X2 [Physcomitrium patens]|eukprot:XP_024401743.1 lanC-like protein GCL1 isoform X2 [Physcomitrella patens]
MYVGMLGTAFLCFKVHQTTGSIEDLDICCNIVDSCAVAAESMKQYVTFLCGQSGIYALGAAAAKCKGDQKRLDWYLSLFNAIAEQSVLAVGPAEGGLGMPYELMYGRAGFLWAALFVNKYVGEETIPWSVTGPVVDAVMAAGRAGASHTQCPLMYQWQGTRYWGAAHGLAGIMHVLMHFPLNHEDMKDVKGTLRYMIKGRFSSGNYPSSEGSTRDRLVHWCYGAPGMALTLCKAAQVYPECKDFKLAAIEAGEVVWKRGLLRRLGLCHGISGNAYVFLALYRLCGEKKHLFRAHQFGKFLHKNAKQLIRNGEMHGGDHGYSLYEGWAGTACLWLDLAGADASRFPGYEF